MFHKKNLLTVAAFLASAAFCFAKPPKILVFSKTTSYYHEAIPNGVAAIQLLGKQYHFDVDTTKDAGMFTEDNLKQYAAVVFVNTADASSTLLNETQQTALMHFIEAGKGFVGIHAAADAEYHSFASFWSC